MCQWLKDAWCAHAELSTIAHALSNSQSCHRKGKKATEGYYYGNF